jgi:hypothetical protein
MNGCDEQMNGCNKQIKWCNEQTTEWKKKKKRCDE